MWTQNIFDYLGHAKLSTDLDALKRAHDRAIVAELTFPFHQRRT